MKPSFIFFIVVLVLGFIAGFYFHEGLDEKVQYERDTCYAMNANTYRNELYSNFSYEDIYDPRKQ